MSYGYTDQSGHAQYTTRLSEAIDGALTVTPVGSAIWHHDRLGLLLINPDGAWRLSLSANCDPLWHADVAEAIEAGWLDSGKQVVR